MLKVVTAGVHYNGYRCKWDPVYHVTVCGHSRTSFQTSWFKDIYSDAADC